MRVVQLPLAEANSRFTALMEGLAITLTKHASQKAVAEQLRLSWDEIHGIMEHAVERGLARRNSEKLGALRSTVADLCSTLQKHSLQKHRLTRLRRASRLAPWQSESFTTFDSACSRGFQARLGSSPRSAAVSRSRKIGFGL